MVCALLIICPLVPPNPFAALATTSVSFWTFLMILIADDTDHFVQAVLLSLVALPWTFSVRYCSLVVLGVPECHKISMLKHDWNVSLLVYLLLEVQWSRSVGVDVVGLGCQNFVNIIALGCGESPRSICCVGMIFFYPLHWLVSYRNRCTWVEIGNQMESARSSFTHVSFVVFGILWIPYMVAV